uniref:Uncharacterized protein n=1 Tax=Panagrolaimus davidi TaxID=227884 RepID=A0A914P2D9_9BILA
MSTKSDSNLVTERKVERDKQQYGNINLNDNVKRKDFEKVHCSKPYHTTTNLEQKKDRNYGRIEEMTKLLRDVKVEDNMEEKELNQKKANNNSTISLNIEAYENSNEEKPVKTPTKKITVPEGIGIMKFSIRQKLLKLNPSYSVADIQAHLKKVYSKYREIFVKHVLKKYHLLPETLFPHEDTVKISSENELNHLLVDQMKKLDELQEFFFSPPNLIQQTYNIYMARNDYDNRGLQNVGRDLVFYLDFCNLYYSERTHDGQLFVAGGVKVPNIIEKRKQEWAHIHAGLVAKGYTLTSNIKALQQRWRQFVNATVQKKIACSGRNGPHRTFTEAEQIVLAHTPDDEIFGTDTRDIGVPTDAPPLPAKRPRKPKPIHTPPVSRQQQQISPLTLTSSSSSGSAARRAERNDPDYRPQTSSRKNQKRRSGGPIKKKKPRMEVEDEAEEEDEVEDEAEEEDEVEEDEVEEEEVEEDEVEEDEYEVEEEEVGVEEEVEVEEVQEDEVEEGFQDEVSPTPPTIEAPLNQTPVSRSSMGSNPSRITSVNRITFSSPSSSAINLQRLTSESLNRNERQAAVSRNDYVERKN